MLSDFDEVREFCRNQRIKMIDFKIIDLNGRWRHVGIPANRFTEKLLQEGIGFDGSNYGYAAVEQSDMVFIPDPTTTVVDPFATVPTLSMIGDVYVIGSPNRPFEQYPRAVSIKAESICNHGDCR